MARYRRHQTTMPTIKNTLKFLSNIRDTNKKDTQSSLVLDVIHVYSIGESCKIIET